MGCDCEKTYNMSMGCCVPTLGPIENYYTKYQTELKIEEAISGLTGTTGCCITPEEVDEKINEATSGITEALTEKQDTLIPGDNITIVNNVISATGSGSGVTSGDVQSMIDSSISGKADTSAVTASLLEKVNVIDNEIPDYYTTVDYTGYFPASGTSAETWNNMITSAKIRVIPPYGCMTQPYNVHISDENGFVASGNVWGNFSALSPYATVTSESEGAPTYYSWYVITPNPGYRISYIEAKHCDDGTLRPITLKIPQILYDGGQSADVIENEIEPELVRLNDAIDSIPTYSAGTNVQINNGVISATDTTYSAGDGISISNSNVISTVTKLWCGTEQEWGQISGGTLDANTIYMVH